MEDIFHVDNYMIAGSSCTSQDARENGIIASHTKVHIRIKNLLKDCMDNEQL